MLANPPTTPETLSVDQFGRDHWNTLLYVETVCTDLKGVVDYRRMRVHPRRHPQFFGRIYGQVDGSEYGTRLADGTIQANHDDWDCVDDLEAAGLVRVEGTGANPVFMMTDAGNAKVAELRQARQRR